jgi:hypothetical protein
MELDLFQGRFDAKECVAMVRELVALQIKFHERKIATVLSEEDIKFREKCIKDLQAQLQYFTLQLQQKESSSYVKATLHVAV